MVDAILQAAEQRKDSEVTKTKAEDVMYVPIKFLCAALMNHSYQMFEVNMDEYLDEEVEYLKQIFDNICKDWDKQVRNLLVYHVHG